MKKEKITNEFKRTEIIPNFEGTCFSTDIWQCSCGNWRRMDEKCIHLQQEDKIIDCRKEKIYEYAL